MLMAATDGALAKASDISAAKAMSGGAVAAATPPAVGCGVYYGAQPAGSACPVAEGCPLPAGYDINMAELGALVR